MNQITLETERLILKNIDTENQNEINSIFELEKNSEVMKYIGHGARTEDEIWEGIHKACAHFKKHGFTFGSVYEKETGHFVGRAGLFKHQWDESSNEIEIGYRLLKKYWGKGYATELVNGLLEYGFNTLKCKEICAAVFAENTPSSHILKKSGAKYVGMTLYLQKFDVEKYIIEKNHSNSRMV